MADKGCEMCDWPEWSRHVLTELSRLSEQTVQLQRSVSNVREDIAGLKVKSGIWGGIAGIATALTVLILSWLKGGAE